MINGERLQLNPVKKFIETCGSSDVFLLLSLLQGKDSLWQCTLFELY